MALSVCSSTGKNTGAIDCEVSRGLPVKLILGSKSFAPADYADVATFDAAMLAAIQLATGSADKLFPFPEIQANTDNTEANTEGTLGYGLKVILKEGKPAYTFNVIAGQKQYKAMRAFNRKTVPVLVLDDQNLVWGKTDSNDNLVGAKALIFVSGNSFKDGNTVEKYTVTVTVSFISAADFHDDAAAMETAQAPGDLSGLVDAPLAASGVVSATTKFEIKIPTAQLNAPLNLHDAYSAELADGALWEAFTGVDFSTALTITGVTANAAPDKTWSVAFDNTAFTALGSGDKIKVQLKSPATLAAAGVTGVEGVAVIITKP